MTAGRRPCCGPSPKRRRSSRLPRGPWRAGPGGRTERERRYGVGPKRSVANMRGVDAYHLAGSEPVPPMDERGNGADRGRPSGRCCLAGGRIGHIACANAQVRASGTSATGRSGHRPEPIGPAQPGWLGAAARSRAEFNPANPCARWRNDVGPCRDPTGVRACPQSSGRAGPELARDRLGGACEHANGKKPHRGPLCRLRQSVGLQDAYEQTGLVPDLPPHREQVGELAGREHGSRPVGAETPQDREIARRQRVATGALAWRAMLRMRSCRGLSRSEICQAAT